MLRAFLVVLVLIGQIPLATPAQAKEPHAGGLPCKQIRQAFGAGATLEQVMQRFNADAEHIMKCLQSRGHRRANAKGKKQEAKQKTRRRNSQASAASKGSAPASAAASPPLTQQPPR